MKKSSILLAVFSVAMVASATVVTNYYDDFSGSSGSLLLGAAPDISVTTSNWTAHSNIKADGSFSINGTLNYSAYVPLTVVAGQTYTLEMNVNLLAASASTRNICLGFGNANSVTSVSWSANARNVAAISLTYAGTVNTYVDGGISSLSAYAGGSTYTNAALKIVLSTYADATPWTAEYFRDGISMGSIAVANGSLIDRVGFSSGQVTGTVDNFTLTTVIPEPATIGMLGLGTLLVFLIRRIRQ